MRGYAGWMWNAPSSGRCHRGVHGGRPGPCAPGAVAAHVSGAPAHGAVLVWPPEVCPLRRRPVVRSWPRTTHVTSTTTCPDRLRPAAAIHRSSRRATSSSSFRLSAQTRASPFRTTPARLTSSPSGRRSGFQAAPTAHGRVSYRAARGRRRVARRSPDLLRLNARAPRAARPNRACARPRARPGAVVIESGRGVRCKGGDYPKRSSSGGLHGTWPTDRLDQDLLPLAKYGRHVPRAGAGPARGAEDAVHHPRRLRIEDLPL